MTQRAEGGGKPITCSGKQQLSCKAIPPGLDALTTARVGICRPMGFRHLRCPKVSKGRAESPLVRPQAHTPCPGWGPDAPTTARMVGLPPRVGQYFLSKRKKVPKKARGTATPGKRLLLPILTAGLATSRASKRASYLQRSCALLCSPFSAVKMGGPFSLRCLSPLCSPAVGGGQAYPLRGEMES